MKKHNIQFGFDVITESGPLPKPTSLRVTSHHEKNLAYSKPLKYMSDALVGLSLMRLNPHLHGFVKKADVSLETYQEAWNQLDPHHTMFERSQERVQALKANVPYLDPKMVSTFEKTFTDTLDRACHQEGLDFKGLWPLLDAMTYLEGKISSPLIFNFGLHFSKPFIDRCQTLYSLLFNLRSLMAVDFNAHVEDASHECLKIDSISDYLPKAEYVVNDAVLYYNFKKLSQPFVAGKNSDVRIEKLMVDPMKKHFEQWAHNAVNLVDQLPKEFLESFRAPDLEEALYLVQMDWLLGSEAGLLFRLREELYGLLNGYEKIFWHERDGRKALKPVQLSLHFELSADTWSKAKAA